MIEARTCKRPRLTYNPAPRVGDHICYYTDLSKLRSHYPDWKLTYDLGQIVDEMIGRMSVSAPSAAIRV